MHSSVENGLSEQDGVPVVRLADKDLSFEAAVDLVTSCIAQLVARGQPHLLLDVRGVGFPPPTLGERLDMVRRWAKAADGRLRIALVMPVHFFDAENIGVISAGNLGLAGQVSWTRVRRCAGCRTSALPIFGAPSGRRNHSSGRVCGKKGRKGRPSRLEYLCP